MKKRKKRLRLIWDNFPPKYVCTDMELGYDHIYTYDLLMIKDGKFTDAKDRRTSIGMSYEYSYGYIEQIAIVNNKKYAEKLVADDGFKLVFSPEKHDINRYILVLERGTDEIGKRWLELIWWKIKNHSKLKK